MALSSVLKDLIKQKKLSQADLCRLTGIPTSLMSNYFNGLKSPTLSNSIKLAESLGVSLDYLSERTTVLQQCPNIQKPSMPSDKRLVEICSNFSKFNDVGRNRLLEISQEMIELKKYTESEMGDEFYNKKSV